MDKLLKWGGHWAVAAFFSAYIVAGAILMPAFSCLSERQQRMSRWAGRFVVVVLVLLAVAGGISMKNAFFESTIPVRFKGDLTNAYTHGSNVIRLAREEQGLDRKTLPSWPAVFKAYLHFYDRVTGGWPRQGYALDYPPMRLFVMTAWTRWIYHPGAGTDPTELPACAIPLGINITAELLAAIGAFLLVHHWVGRVHPPAESWRPTVCGAVAALLMWFNVGVLVDGHGWPQWDVWLVPFYFFMMLAASRRRWLTAGLIFGFGIMFKGQLLAAGAVLLLWPVFSGQWRGFARLLTGVLAAVAAIDFLWVAQRPMGLAMVIAVVIIVIALRLIFARYLRGQHAAMIATCAASVFIAAVLFGASFSWVQLGFFYGADFDGDKLAKTGAHNLGSLLRDEFHWSQPDDFFGTISVLGHSRDITIGQVMILAYAVCIVLCAIALAVHTRRNDPRGLMAIAAPWMLFYALLPQLSNRYSMWGAATTVLCAGIGLGPILLHLVISVCSGITILWVLMRATSNAEWWQGLYDFVVNMHSGLAWLTLVSTAIVFYLALTPSVAIRRNDVVPTAM